MAEARSFCKKYDESRISVNMKWMRNRMWCSCKNYSQMNTCAYYKKVAPPITTDDKWRFTPLCKWAQVWHGERRTNIFDCIECVSRDAAVHFKLEGF